MRLTLSSILAVLVVMAVAQVDRTVEEEAASNFFNAGSMALADKSYQVAFDNFSSALQLNEDVSDYYYGRGVASYFLENHYESVKDLSKAIALDPDQSNYYYYLGAALKELEEYEDAIKYFDKAIVLNLFSDQKISALNAQFQIAFCKIKQQNYWEALVLFDELIVENPDNDKAYVNRGIVRGYLDNFKGACQDFSMAAELGSSTAPKYAKKYCKGDNGSSTGS